MDNEKLIGELRVGITRLMDDVKKANLELEKINQGKDFKEINIKADISKVQSEVQQLNQTLAKTTDLNIDTSNAIAQLSQFKQKVVSMTDEAGNSVQKLLSEMSKLNLGTGITARVTQGYDIETQKPLNPVAEYNIDFGKIAREREVAENAARKIAEAAENQLQEEYLRGWVTKIKEVEAQRIAATRAEETIERQLQSEYVNGWTAKIKEVEAQRIAAIKTEEMAEKQLQDEYVRGQTAKIREVDTRNIDEQRQKISEQNSLYQQQEQIIGQIYQTETKLIKAEINETLALEKLKALDIERLNAVQKNISNKGLYSDEKSIALKEKELRLQQELDVAQKRQIDNTHRQNTALTGTKTILGKFFNVAIYSTGYYIYNAFITSIKNGIGYVSELNNQLTKLRIEMNLSDSDLVKMTSSAQTLARELGTTVSEVLKAAEVYSNINETVDSIVEKTRAGIVLSNLGGIDITSATDAIQAISLQFNILDKDAMHISDVITKVAAGVGIDFNKAVTTISDSVKVSGNVAQEAGISLERYASIVASIAERTRIPGSTLGQSINFVDMVA